MSSAYGVCVYGGFLYISLDTVYEEKSTLFISRAVEMISPPLPTWVRRPGGEMPPLSCSLVEAEEIGLTM